MDSTRTVRVDEELDRQLSAAAERMGQSRSEIVREALRRRLAVFRLEALREQAMPFAEVKGYLTDDDVFEEVS